MTTRGTAPRRCAMRRFAPQRNATGGAFGLPHPNGEPITVGFPVGNHQINAAPRSATQRFAAP